MLDIMKIREDFPILSNSDVCYFDSGATSLKPKAVIDAVIRGERNCNNLQGTKPGFIAAA